ncbi:MAG: phage tail length tape measure family protein, partial [Dyella sp.]
MADEASLGTARVDITVSTEQMQAALDAAKSRYSDFSAAGQSAIAQLSAAQKRQLDSLLKQADTIGFNRQQMIAYNAAVKGLPTDVINDLVNKMQAAGAASQSAAESVKGIGDALKSSTISDSQLLRANQALVTFKADADAARQAMEALNRSQAENDANLRKVLQNSAVPEASLTNAQSDTSRKSTSASFGTAGANADRQQAQMQAASNANRQAVADEKALDAIMSKRIRTTSDLAAAEQALDRLMAAGKLTTEEQTAAFVALDAAQRKMGDTTGMDQAAAGTKKVDAAVSHLSFSSAGARRELGVLIGELLQGNFRNFEGSITTLANRTGLLELAFTPLGAVIGGAAAAVALMGFAAVKGAEEQDALNKAIISTGDYAGVTTGQLMLMASTVARSPRDVDTAAQALDKLAASGVVTGNRLQEAAQGAVDFSNLTGKSVDEAVDQFVKLQTDPVAAIKALDDQYHLLSAAQYDNVKALAAQGDAEGAAAIAQTAATQALAQRAAEVKNATGKMEGYWDSLKDHVAQAWDRMKGIGAAGTAETDLSSVNSQLDAYRTRLAGIRNVDKGTISDSDLASASEIVLARDNIKDLLTQKATDQGAATMDQWVAQSQAENLKIQAQAQKGSDLVSELLAQAKTDNGKAAAIAALKAATAARIKANPNEAKSYNDEQALGLKQIDKQYADHSGDALASAQLAANLQQYKD